MFQRDLIADIEHLARINIDLDYESPPPDFELSGLHYPRREAWALWRAWEDHGVMPHAGGYLDQPPEWRQTIETFQAMYGIAVYEVRQEVDARKRNHS